MRLFNDTEQSIILNMTKEKINNILLIYLFDNDKVNVNRIRKKRYENIRKYLHSYFIDNTSSYVEILYRIKYNIERNYCIECNKETYFKGISYYKQTGKLYADFCSCKCKANNQDLREKYKKVCLLKYGVDNPMKCVNIINKGKETCKKKYGVVRASQLKEYQNKAKDTNLKKYGVEVPLQNISIKEKWHDTCYEKYGASSPLGNKDIYKQTEETTYRKYGVRCVFQRKDLKEKLLLPKTKQKRYDTMRKNHTFNTSKIEQTIYNELVKLYEEENVIREYKDYKRYPYRCDFYIKTLDLFIEVQGYYTHNTHPYNECNEEDKKKVEEYKEKYGSNSQLITIWTIKDVEKRNCAKTNKLNYLEIWEEDIKKINKDSTILKSIIDTYIKQKN